MGKKWKNYNFKKNDPKGFHFAKNSRFLLLPKNGSYEGYNEKDPIDILIDYKNNVHYIQQDKEKKIYIEVICRIFINFNS